MTSSVATGNALFPHDEPEEKLNPDGLGHMHMTRSVKLSLLALRVYLIMLVLLVLYSVVEHTVNLRLCHVVPAVLD